jgi:tetratricopeptide (TPR) repeat protein
MGASRRALDKRKESFMKKTLEKDRHTKISVLVSFPVLVLALAFLLLHPSGCQRADSTSIPALPDLAGQPRVLVDELQKMNEEALRSPSSDRSVGNLGMAYQSNFFYPEAKTCYKRASELNDREWRWVYYSALIDEELGDTKATIEKLNRTLEINPAVSQAWFRLGNSYLKSNSYQDAEEAFHQVLALKEYRPEANSRIDLSNNGAFPLKAYASFNLARAKFQQNKLNEAKTTLEQLVEQHPKFGPAYRLLGNVYQKLGDERKSYEFDTMAGDFESYLPPADPLYDEMILSSRNTAFLLKQFDIAAKSENYKWTLSLMDHLLAISPNDGEVLTKRIKLALDMQVFSTVDSLLPTFYKLCGSDDKKLIDMARYFVYRGQYEPAVILLRRATAIDPKAFDAHLLFMDVLTEFKQYEMGINYCKELISMDPKNAEIRNRLARMDIEQGMIEEARQQIKIAQHLSPSEELRLIMLGRIAKKLQSSESALDYFRKALKVNPRNVNLQLEVGNYLVDLQQWAEALAHFQSSLTTSPNDLDLLERYAWLLAVCPAQDLSNGEKALALANRLVLRRKYTKAQEMRCGTTLAAAYARSGHFDQALEIANKYLGWAKTMRDTSYLRRLQVMISFFQSKKAFVL